MNLKYSCQTRRRPRELPGRRHAAPGSQPVASGVSTWDFVRMLIILAVVVLVIYLLFWLLRRGAGKKIQENDLIHVLGSAGAPR